MTLVTIIGTICPLPPTFLSVDVALTAMRADRRTTRVGSTRAVSAQAEELQQGRTESVPNSTGPPGARLSDTGSEKHLGGSRWAVARPCHAAQANVESGVARPVGLLWSHCTRLAPFSVQRDCLCLCPASYGFAVTGRSGRRSCATSSLARLSEASGAVEQIAPRYVETFQRFTVRS